MSVYRYFACHPSQVCSGNLDRAIDYLQRSLQSAQGSEYVPTGAEGPEYIPSTGGVVAQETGGMEVTARTAGDGAGPTNGPGQGLVSGTIHSE